MGDNAILVLNAGSSSIKLALYPAANGDEPLYAGQVEEIGTVPKAHLKNAAGTTVDLPPLPKGADHAAAAHWLVNLVDDHLPVTVIAGGHRVVHGGKRFSAPTLIDDAVEAEIERLVPLARTHNPHSLAAIRAVRREWPDRPQVACFDTAFHRTMPDLARRFALPSAITDQDVERYGFHGLSYRWIAGQLPQISKLAAEGRTIVAHLGNGASACALKAGNSIATTMGLTTIDGLMMGNRPGAFDSGVVLYMQEELGLDLETVRRILFRESGLLGVSGISSDMRTLLASDDPKAAIAVDLFCYRAIIEFGGLAAALGGLDALVFTGGIGEHAAPIRDKIVAGFSWLGAKLDGTANVENATRISAKDSAIDLLVIPTNEEAVIARETRGVIGA